MSTVSIRATKRFGQFILAAWVAGIPAWGQNPKLQINADGSVDVFFGPKAPVGKESNWIQTVPGKGWNTLLRLYSPLEPWFKKTWRPGEIELQR